jgi:hypothetical protein
VLARLPDHPAKRIHDLLPCNWMAVAAQAPKAFSGCLASDHLARPGMDAYMISS